MCFDSNESLDVETEDEQRDELEFSELMLLSSFPIEESDGMDETLGSLWNGNWNDEVKWGKKDTLEVLEIGRMSSVSGGKHVK